MDRGVRPSIGSDVNLQAGRAPNVVDLRPRAAVTRRPFGQLPSTLAMAGDSHLCEDFVLSDEIAVDVPTGTSSVAPFVNPANGQREALVDITADGIGSN